MADPRVLMDVDRDAGIARLAAPGLEDHDVIWFITDAKGEALPGVPGPAADVVLKPGRYKLRTRIDGSEKASAFTIEPGKVSAIIQAN